MPLIVITGTPVSGKTTRANQLKKYFEEQKKDVLLVSEFELIQRAGFSLNSLYQDPQKEKQMRGNLKSEVLRALGPNNLVILDGSNYIKGYRYELFCGAKASKCTQCTVQCMSNFQKSYELNQMRDSYRTKYTRENFDALCMRYETPDSKNRWDYPLFVLQTDAEINFEEINRCLFEKRPPLPNMSTRNAPLSDTNFLYELDKITNDLTKQLIAAKKLKANEFKVPGHENQIINISDATVSQLNNLRRQYITYSKMHTPEINNILTLYVQYLKTNLAN